MSREKSDPTQNTPNGGDIGNEASFFKRRLGRNLCVARRPVGYKREGRAASNVLDQDWVTINWKEITSYCGSAGGSESLPARCGGTFMCVRSDSQREAFIKKLAPCRFRAGLHGAGCQEVKNEVRRRSTFLLHTRGGQDQMRATRHNGSHRSPLYAYMYVYVCMRGCDQ